LLVSRKARQQGRDIALTLHNFVEEPEHSTSERAREIFLNIQTVHDPVTRVLGGIGDVTATLDRTVKIVGRGDSRKQASEARLNQFQGPGGIFNMTNAA
jgi:hypothetical protein